MLDIRPIADPVSLSTLIYEQLKVAIASMNIYDDGIDLRLDERRLSEQFGSSRTPLREALMRLDQEGLVTIRSRRGVYIVRKTKLKSLRSSQSGSPWRAWRHVWPAKQPRTPRSPACMNSSGALVPPGSKTI